MSEVILDLTKPVPLVEEEDDETLVSIDRGARDADEGRLTPLEKVEKMLPKWISESRRRAVGQVTDRPR